MSASTIAVTALPRFEARLPALAAGLLLTSAALGQDAPTPSEPDEAVAPSVPLADTAPFLGTWSGVFTTQDNEFWGLEDFVCFPGCPVESRQFMIDLLEDPANDELPVGALFGQATGYTGEYLAGLLTPAGQEILEANDPFADPKLRCEPYGFVRQVTNPLPIVVRRDGSELVFYYEEWSMLRTVFLDGRPHPVAQTPSLLGHSVGRVEDGMLIIDTKGVHPGWFSVYSNAGHSSELTATERYWIAENPRRLELELTLEDPVVLTEPYVVTKTWLYTPEVELVQDRCGDMPTKF